MSSINYIYFTFTIIMFVPNYANCIHTKQTQAPIGIPENGPTRNETSTILPESSINVKINVESDDSTTPSQPPVPKPKEFKHFDCRDRICIPKCCPITFLKEIYGGCGPVQNYGIDDWSEKLNSHFQPVHWLPILPQEPKYEKYVCPMYETYEYSLQRDGTVYIKEIKDYIRPEFYCMDNMYDEDKERIKEAGFFCHEAIVKSRFEKMMDKVLIGSLVTSTAFLFAILVLYLLSPEKKDLQSKCTMASCLSLFFGFVAIIINASNFVLYIAIESCVAFAIASQFFMLSFYFWLNVMCFEIARIMRGTMNLYSYKDLTRSEKRYFIYCGYAWGAPLIISLVTIVMQYLPYHLPFEMEKYIIRPDIAEGRCWFKESGGSVYAYYYGIVIFIHALNASLMGYTACLLYRKEAIYLCCSQKNSINLRTHSSNNYIALFKQQLSIFVMYVFIWILNVLSLTNPRSFFWRIIDVVVGLQGFFLFLIVIRPKKYAMLRIAAERMSSLAKDISMRINSKKMKVSPLTENSSSQDAESKL